MTSVADGPSFSALPTDPLLASLIREALESRPEVAQGIALVSAERQRVSQVGALSDPILTLGIQNDSFTRYSIGEMETSWYTVMVTQQLFWPGKRHLRGEVAGFQSTLAAATLARTRLSVEAEVRRGYVDLVLAREQLGLLSEQGALWDKSAKITKARYSVGEAPQSDLLRAQLELIRIRQQRLALQASEQLRVQALNRLRGHLLDEPIPTSSTLEHDDSGPLPSAARMQADAEARSPELQSIRTAMEQSGSRLALARVEQFPDFSIAAGVMPRGALVPMWQLLVGVSLPVYTASKQARAVEEATLRREANASGERAVIELLRLRTAQRRTLLELFEQTNTLYRQALLVQSEATANSTLAQYEVGKAPFSSLLEALSGYLADRAAYLGSLAQAQRLAIAQFELSPDEPTPFAPGGPGSIRSAASTGGATSGAASSSGEPGSSPSAAGMGGM